jgi:hypothetical protein
MGKKTKKGETRKQLFNSNYMLIIYHATSTKHKFFPDKVNLDRRRCCDSRCHHRQGQKLLLPSAMPQQQPGSW